MDLFDDLRTRLYTQAIQYCQQSFSARMQIPGRGVAFVQRIDQVHEPMEAELRDGLTRIQQAYDRTMNLHYYDSMALGGGIGALLGGIACAAAGPIGWGFGFFLVAGGASTLGVALKAEASKTRLLALQALFKREVEFVTLNIPAINYHMSQHPEDNVQVKPLSTHFNWVLSRIDGIEKELLAKQIKEGEENSQRSSDDIRFNLQQAASRSNYCSNRLWDPSASNTANILYPDRILIY